MMVGWIGTFAVLVLFFASTPSYAEKGPAQLLARWQSSRVIEGTDSTVNEITEIELLFARSLDRPMEKETVDAWADLGFVSEPFRIQGDNCVLLFEDSESKRGRGMFLLCPTRTQASTLLIPHGFHDRFTAEIGVLFASEGRFRAVAWNTTPRATVGDEESPLDRHDATHTTENYFTGLARAASVLGLPGPMVQLHGFAPQLRSTEAGRSARAILSSGTNAPHQSTLDVAACLKAELGDRLLVYPTEVAELGGTQNRVAEVLRSWGRKDFLHLELSFALRQRLVEDAEARRSLVECVGGASR